MLIPQHLTPLFWDVDPAKLERDQHRTFVVERVLEKGRPESVRWLGRIYAPQEMVEVLRISKNISRRTAHLWSKLLQVPPQEIACLQKPYHHQLSNF